MVLNRLDDSYVPPELTRHVRAFRAAQAGLAAATRRAKTARQRRDAALSALARADGALERTLLGLAKRIVAAGLGAKKAPFTGLSPKTPAQIAALDHVHEVAEVERLVGKIRGIRAPRLVKRAIAACAAAAAALERARTGVLTAQQTYARTLDARDALLDKWTTSLARLQRRAEEVLSENAEMLAHIFAPPVDDDEPRTVLDLRPALPNVMNGVHTT
jgi:hypothetical protein